MQIPEAFIGALVGGLGRLAELDLRSTALQRSSLHWLKGGSRACVAPP